MSSRFEQYPELWSQVLKVVGNDGPIEAIGDWWEPASRATMEAFERGETVFETLFMLTPTHLYIFYFEEKRRLFARKLEFNSHEYAPLSDVKKSNFKAEKADDGDIYALSWRLKIDGIETPKEYILELERGAEHFAEKFNNFMKPFEAKTEKIPLAQQLDALNKLKADGVLTQEEFTRAKEIFIGKSPDKKLLLENNLRSLKSLKDAGVLSPQEYEAKKWEVISS